MPNLESIHGRSWEVLKTSGHVGVADRRVDGSNQSIGEEGADAAGVAQAVHVDQLLGGAGEGEPPDVSGDVVDEGVRHSNVARVGVHQTLVIRLQPQILAGEHGFMLQLYRYSTASAEWCACSACEQHR